jgi:predicted AAA+ superfamily ATPase
MVAQLLRAYKEYRGIFDDMYYWAPSGRSGMEVDFILVRGLELIAVEAKSGNTFRDAWCKGLRAIKALKGLQRRIIVYPRGPAMKTRDGIDILPFKQFADELAVGAL